MSPEASGKEEARLTNEAAVSTAMPIIVDEAKCMQNASKAIENIGAHLPKHALILGGKHVASSRFSTGTDGTAKNWQGMLSSYL